MSQCLPPVLDYQELKRESILVTQTKVKHHMKVQRLSVRALAKRSNVAWPTLDNFLKHGTDIKLSTISRLARGFNLPIRELLP